MIELIKQTSKPASPAVGYLLFYAKDDNKLYKQDSNGTETLIEGSTGVGGSDGKVKVSATDLTSNYLFNKLVAGTGVTIEKNAGMSETITISVSGLDAYVTLDTEQTITGKKSFEGGLAINNSSSAESGEFTGSDNYPGVILDSALLLDIIDQPALLFGSQGGTVSSNFMAYSIGGGLAINSGDARLSLNQGEEGSFFLIGENPSDTNLGSEVSAGTTDEIAFMTLRSRDFDGADSEAIINFNSGSVSEAIDSSIDIDVDVLDFSNVGSFVGLPGGSTASNIGTGEGVFAQKVLDDLEFKSIKAGSNIILNASADEIEISSTGTSAGISTRVYLTGDVETVNLVNYYGLSTGQGAVASVEQQVTVGDNQKLFFGQDFISDSYAFDTSIKSGAYTSILTVEADSSAAEKRYTMETYVTDINGTPINAGGPIGDLGVETIGILDSGIISLDTNDVTQIELINQLEFDVPVVAGQRIRLHLSAEKVGAAGGNVTLSLFSGSDYVSYFDVPANIFSTDVTDLSSVNTGGTQAQTNEILDAKIDAIDLDSVLTVGNTSTLGATFGDNVNINNNGILFVDGTTGHRGVDWKTNGILNWAWLMSSTDNIKLNKYNTTTGLYVSTPLEFEHGTDNALFNGGATFGNIPVGTQVGLVGYDATGKLIQGTGGGGASDWSHDFEYTPATSASVQMKTHSSFTVGGLQYIPNDGATYTITGFTLSNGLTSTVQTSDVNIRAYSFNATGGQRGVGTGTLLYDWTAISTTGAQAVQYYTRSNSVTGLSIAITNGQFLALDLIPNFYSLENTSVTVHIERS